MGWDPTDGSSRVLLDNNAIGDLYRSKLGQTVRCALRRLVRRNRCEVFLTISQLTELTGLQGDRRHPRYVREMVRLSRGRLLQAYPHRVEEEMHRGPLRRRQALYKRAEAAPLMSALHDQVLVGQERAHARKVKAAFLQLETVARTAVKGWPDFKQDWPRWKQRWDRNRDEVIAEWAADEVDRLVKAVQGPTASFDRSAEFDLRRLPTVWYATAFHLARIRLVTDGKVALKASDVWDKEHFGDAAYADLLVTTDAGLIRIAAETGLQRPRVVTFEQWGSELIGFS
jgi:hypothetical protein